MAEWAGPELAPGLDVRTDDEVLDYIRKTHNTVYHPSCTVKMGADDDLSAPLDASLRVKGVRGLRVVDGSVMPSLVTVNPCITIMMIGEKCADLIKAET
jgi:choline oxidase